MGNIRKHTKNTKQDYMTVLKHRFSYLSDKERDKLLYGDDFVQVPTQELKRLRIDTYPYLL